MAYSDDVPQAIHERVTTYWLGVGAGGVAVARRANDARAEDSDDGGASDLPLVGVAPPIDFGRGRTAGAERLAASILADALAVSPMLALQAMQSGIAAPTPEGRRALMVARIYRRFADECIATFPGRRSRARVAISGQSIRDWCASAADSR